MSEITIGLMTLEDIEAVHAIETACFRTPWSKESFYREVTDNACARYVVLREDGVAVTPGAAFGADGRMRISYCCSMDLLKEGLDRLERFVTRLEGDGGHD